jgi:hypothetical protein
VVLHQNTLGPLGVKSHNQNLTCVFNLIFKKIRKKEKSNITKRKRMNKERVWKRTQIGVGEANWRDDGARMNLQDHTMIDSPGKFRPKFEWQVTCILIVLRL